MDKEEDCNVPLLDSRDGVRFPEGMRVLALDANIVCLTYLVSLLRKCLYEVTETTKADEALKLLKEKTFDIVIIDVIREDMDGFKLLETIGLEMDIPVVMVSANDEVSNVMKGIRNGARDYLLKPVRMEEIKNIWQHVVRKNLKNLEKPIVTEVKMDPNPMPGEEQEEANTESNANGGVSDSLKKSRVVWTKDLHHKFLDAIQQLDGNVVPKKILEVMNVPSLTREHVASHLQKYRSMLKKQNARKSQQNSCEVDTNWNNTGNAIFKKRSDTSNRNKTKQSIQSLIEYKPFNIPKPSHQNVFQNYAQFPHVVDQKHQGMHNSGLENPNLASSWTGSSFHVPEYRGTSGKFLNYNACRECGPSSMPFYSYPTLPQLNPAQQMVRDPSAGMCSIPQHPLVLGSAQNVFPGQNDGRSSLNRSSSSGNVNFTRLVPGFQNSMQFPVSTDLAENVQSKLGQQYPTETSDNVSSFHPNNSSFMDDDLSDIVNQFSSNGPPRL